MTKIESKAGHDLTRAWDRPGTPVPKTVQLRDLISQHTKDIDEFSEISIGGSRPIIVRRTESDDMVIEIKATYRGSSRFSEEELLSTAGRNRQSKVRDVLQSLESPAATTEEIADKIRCSPIKAAQTLTELEHKGIVESKRSGETILWWLNNKDTGPNGLSESPDLPEFVRDGLMKSQEDMNEWLEGKQQDGETLDETYERLRGNPAPEDLRRFIQVSESSVEEMIEAIRTRRDSDHDGKSDLQDLFK